MRPLFPIILVTSLLLASCGQVPSLWGIYTTPTGVAFDPAILPSTLQPATLPPTPLTLAFSPIPFTSTPEIQVSATPLIPTLGTPLTRPPFTPTFNGPTTLYYSQNGDTLPGLAVRFNVKPTDIPSAVTLSKANLIDPGTLLVIPDRIKPLTLFFPILRDLQTAFKSIHVLTSAVSLAKSSR